MSGSQPGLALQMLESIGMDPQHAFGPDVARIEVHANQVVGVKLVPGLQVQADETADGIQAAIRVEAGAQIAQPVHVCFGIIPEDGLQLVDLDIHIEEQAQVSILAHCTFPNAKQVEHRMEAAIRVDAGASYQYFERHVHGPHGGVQVIPNARIVLHEDAVFATEFELIKGRAGKIAFDYQAECRDRSLLEMTARISGRDDDVIVIRECADLVGAEARAALISHIALRDRAAADIYNRIVASGDHARGHVDCKEIVVGHAVAKATPIVEVRNATAHVTHEAAIGSVDSKQLQTLLSRGLDEDTATGLIIEGLLSKQT